MHMILSIKVSLLSDCLVQYALIVLCLSFWESGTVNIFFFIVCVSWLTIFLLCEWWFWGWRNRWMFQCSCALDSNIFFVLIGLTFLMLCGLCCPIPLLKVTIFICNGSVKLLGPYHYIILCRQPGKDILG